MTWPRSARLGDAAEGIVELAVEGVELLIDRLVFGDRPVGNFLQPGHRGLGGLEIRMRSGDHGRADGGTERAGLRRAGNAHLAAGDVGVDLHEHRVFLGDAAGADDALDGHAVFADAVDDGAGAEGGALDERAVDFRLGGVERLAEQQAGEQLIDEDGAVAVVPIEREQAGLAGLLRGGLVGEFAVQGGIAVDTPSTNHLKMSPTADWPASMPK